MNLGQVKEEENAAATMTYLLMRVIYTCIEGKSQWCGVYPIKHMALIFFFKVMIVQARFSISMFSCSCKYKNIQNQREVYKTMLSDRWLVPN